MNKLILETELVTDILDGYPEETHYSLVQIETVEEWRWGVVYEAIIKDSSDNTFWGTTYRVQIGDNYYNNLEDSNTVHFYPVEAVEVTTIKYKRIK